MVTCLSAEARIQPVSSSQLVTALPSKEVILSFGFRPAAAAGVSLQSAELGSTVSPALTWHFETSAMVVVWLATPNPISSTAVNTTPISRFIAGPPSMMMIFFQTGSR